jgi:predicted lipid-binding transport protein (Tim44 family)
LIGPFAEFLTAVLMIGLLVVAGLFILRMLRGAGRKGEVGPRPMEPAYQAPSPARVATPIDTGTVRPGSLAASLAGSGVSDTQTAGERAPGVPDDFDVNGFLRTAKVHFHRLQAAWDRKDVDDLSEFTTPEVLAELRMQLSEQGSDAERNEIADLDAELLAIEEGPVDYLASVRFSGTSRSAQAPAGESFQEVWNLSKRKDGRGGWLLAGIQQVH